jgi:hypothetical protein
MAFSSSTRPFGDQQLLLCAIYSENLDVKCWFIYIQLTRLLYSHHDVDARVSLDFAREA